MTEQPSSFAIGVDIGGTNTKFGIVDKRGNIWYQDRMRTTDHEQVGTFVEELYEKLQPMIEKVGGIDKIKGIGMGAPNGNYYKGTIEYAPNLKWKGIVPMAAIVQEKFDIPAILTNDANAAAQGEMMYGAAKGMKDFIVITLGTGVGSGIIVNGQLVYGHDGFAGELGHVTVIPDGRVHWGTGMKGSLEAYCSATGMRLTALELLEKYPDVDTPLRKIKSEDIDSKAIYDAATQGCALSKEIFEYTGNILGLALANFVMFSSPEAIVLFGGVTAAGEMLLKPTRLAMEANVLPIFRNKVKLIFSDLKEADAAILGASALVWE